MYICTYAFSKSCKGPKLEAGVCQKTHKSLHSSTGTLTEIIPIVPEVHATLHLFCRINVSAWMSHWTELRHRAREARSGGWAAAGRRDVCANTCAVPTREQVRVVSAVVRSGRRECSRSGPCFLSTYSPALLCTSFPSAVLGKISSNLT